MVTILIRNSRNLVRPPGKNSILALNLKLKRNQGRRKVIKEQLVIHKGRRKQFRNCRKG